MTVRTSIRVASVLVCFATLAGCAVDASEPSSGEATRSTEQALTQPCPKGTVRESFPGEAMDGGTLTECVPLPPGALSSATLPAPSTVDSTGAACNLTPVPVPAAFADLGCTTGIEEDGRYFFACSGVGTGRPPAPSMIPGLPVCTNGLACRAACEATDNLTQLYPDFVYDCFGPALSGYDIVVDGQTTKYCADINGNCTGVCAGVPVTAPVKAPAIPMTR